MEHRFRRVDRDQQYLLPPDVREWLPPEHLALFVVDVVDQLDLSAFVAGNRSSRERGRPAYHPSVMVGILLYASMVATMSSRRIERALATDVGFRVVAANERPDHGTICRFLNRFGPELGELFKQVVGLAAEAGLVDPTLVAVDGTKMPGNASMAKNEHVGDLRARFHGWSDAVAANDAVEDAAEAESKRPVPEMADERARQAWIEERLRERETEPDDARMNLTDPDSGLLPRSGGGWCQGYNAQAAAVAGGIVVAADVTANPSDATQLMSMARRVAEAVHDATGERAGVLVGDAGYWNTDAIEQIADDPDLPDPMIATAQRLPKEPPAPIDVDHRAYHEQLATWEAAVAAEKARRAEVIGWVADGDLFIREGAELLDLSVPATHALKQAYERGGVDAITVPRRGRPDLTRPKPPKPPSRATRARHAMNVRLTSPAGISFYRQRQAIIEPVFGDIKTNRRITRLWRRGTDKVRTEWLWILLGHNLTILHTRT